MNDEQISDYTLLCPDDRRSMFHDAARLLIEAHKNMQEPTDLSRGHASAVNAELLRLKSAVERLSPEARQELMFREVEYIENQYDDVTDRIFGDVFSNGDEGVRRKNANLMKDLQKIAVFENVDGALKRLSVTTEEKYTKKKVEWRLRSLTEQSAIRWKMHGGKVSDTEGVKTYPAFLETLLYDLEWSANARVLTQNYINK